ncbi:MAG: GlsB/YeaQ/YmgE family stress response membrane protein [Acidobacteria bacterium]|nr:GlsB/YeaQ/YmgE family stress response membrane protein [Acidobacteriota bacterium]
MLLLITLGSIIWTIIIGLIVGILAKVIMPGRDGGGFILTVLLGIAGSIVGGLLSNFVPWRVGEFGGFVLAIIGAIIVLAIYRMITGQRST